MGLYQYEILTWNGTASIIIGDLSHLLNLKIDEKLLKNAWSSENESIDSVYGMFSEGNDAKLIIDCEKDTDLFSWLTIICPESLQEEVKSRMEFWIPYFNEETDKEDYPYPDDYKFENVIDQEDTALQRILKKHNTDLESILIKTEPYLER